MNDISFNKSFINYCSNINDFYQLDFFINNKHKIICLYDSNENIINKQGITNNKCNNMFIKNIEIFASNKRSFSSIPIIILNKLSLNSINLIKQSFILKNPTKYNISIIVIGENKITFDNQ